ncbi:MAG: NAD-dependent epimerase/dehydratase family protein [Saprospiraceae bacterium]|nr:NAD-dependent epimerase/dehydratase family protein [Saprospiraceae bacterium]
MNQKILVTGASGLVGSHLIRLLLARGYQHIRAIKRPSSDMSMVQSVANAVEWVEGDILDPIFLEDIMHGVSVVFHCAAKISFEARDAKSMYRTNVEGTTNMINASLHAQVNHFIFFSSVAALGRSRNNQTLTEKSIWEKSPYNTRYGISKFQAEQEVWRGQAEGLTISILNPSIILGGSQWTQGPARFFPMIAGGWRFFPIGNSGFVDVRDVANASITIMEESHTGKRYILNAGHFTYQEFFQLIAQNLKVKAPNFTVKPWMNGIAWRIAAFASRILGKRILLTKETARQSARTFYYDNTRSIRDLGITYRPLERTISETANLYKQSQQASPTSSPSVLPF